MRGERWPASGRAGSFRARSEHSTLPGEQPQGVVSSLPRGAIAVIRRRLAGRLPAQVEFYLWLLRGNGLRVSDRAWFVYANGIRDGEAFDDLLRFRTKVIPYDGSDAWVESALRDVADCLASGSAPAPSPGCAFCEYVARAWAAG